MDGMEHAYKGLEREERASSFSNQSIHMGWV
jgi:hypothetical protein